MSPDARPQFFKTEPLTHPRQRYLLNRLKQPALSPEAVQIILEAIAQYDYAFGMPPAPDEETVRGKFTADIPDDADEGELLAGKNHVLTVKFSALKGDTEFTDDLFTPIGVMVSLKDMPGVNLYPDYIRYIPLDVHGNSRETCFLLETPESLRGHSGQIELGILDGGVFTEKCRLDIRFI